MIWKAAEPAVQDQSDPTSWSVGYAFVDEGRCLHGEEIGLHLRGGLSRLEDNVKSLNGCFAVVISNDSGWTAITDRNGSIPLYAARNSQGVILSEDPWEVVRRLEVPPELDELAAFDLVRLGYVAGARTLIRGVEVLPPGSITSVANRSLRSVRYWRYGYRAERMSDEFARHELARTLAGMGNRFTACLERMGRNATVPLSGGFDTRIIASLLVSSGCEVNAVTYGRPDSPEVTKAREVAAILGLHHSVAPIDSSYLNEEFIGDSVREVGITARFTCGTGARHLPQLDSTIAMPGHISTFGGAHGPEVGLVRTRKQLRDYLYFRHYHFPYADQLLGDIVTVDQKMLRWLHLDEILEDYDPRLGIAGEVDRYSSENPHRKLFWMEMRAYERRFDWMLPLFDHELVDFFARVPYRMRIGRELYVRTPLSFMFKETWPTLLSIGRVGGRPFGRGPSKYRRMRVMKGLQPFSGWILAPLLTRFRNLRASRRRLPPNPYMPDPLWFWFLTDATARDFLISRVETLAPSIIDPPRLKKAMLGTRVTDYFFQRVVAGAITLDEVSKQAGRLWAESLTRPK